MTIHKRIFPTPSAPLIWMLAALLLGVLTTQATQAAEPIGHLVVAAGKLTAVGVDGQTRRLKRLDPIYAGDTLKTGGNVFAQVRFKDGALIALRPDTEFEIQDYRYNGSEDGSEKAIFKLIKGGFRTITGAIGHKNKQNYQVTTPVATIGIRGTHYGLRLVAQEFAEQSRIEGNDLQQGLYGGVVDGEIAVDNQAGGSSFGNDRYFYVADANSAARTLIAPPGVVFDVDRRSGGNSEDQEEADGQQDQPSGQEGDEAQDEGDDAAAGPDTADNADQSDPEADADADANGDATADADQGNTGSSTDNQSVSNADSGEPTEATAGSESLETANPGAIEPSAGGVAPTTGLTAFADTALTNPASLDLAVATPATVVVEPTFEANEGFDPTSGTKTFTRAALGSDSYVMFLAANNGAFGETTGRIHDDGSSDHQTLLNAAGNIVTVQERSTSGTDAGVLHRFEFGTATLKEASSGHGFNWGRWSGGYTISDDGVAKTTPSDLHFIYVANPIAASTLANNLGGHSEPILNFNWLSTAGTTPTDTLGNTGTIEYANLSINFATQLVTRYDLKVISSGKTFIVKRDNNNLTLDQALSGSFLLKGSCSGCSGSNAEGQASLSFADSAGSFAASGYSIRDTNGSFGVAGALVFEKISTQSPPVTAPNNATTHIATITSSGTSAAQANIHSGSGGGEIKITTINGVGNVVTRASDGTSPNQDIFDSGRADLTNTGGNTIGVNWGRWQDGWSAQLGGSGVNTHGHAHFIYSDNITTQNQINALSSIATFSLVPGSGTSPTNQNGAVGTLNSASMTVNFGPSVKEISNYKVNFSVAGRTFDMQQPTNATLQLTQATNISLNDNISTATGNASVRLLGSTASHAMSAYSASDGGTHAVGTLLMQR